MTGISITLYIYVLLISSILLLWKTILVMIRKKKIAIFLPFFITAIFMCFNAAFSFYELFYNFIGGFMEIL